MSWWTSLDKAGQISKLAYSALKNAQQKIDEVLDIQDSQNDAHKTFTSSHTLLNSDLSNPPTRLSPVQVDTKDHPEDSEHDQVDSGSEYGREGSPNHFSSSDGTPSNKHIPGDIVSRRDHEWELSASNRNSPGQLPFPLEPTAELESRRRMLAALNLFSVQFRDSPGLKKSGSDGGLCPPSASKKLIETGQMQSFHLLADELDTIATGSDIEVLSGCTSANGEYSCPVNVDSSGLLLNSSYERTVSLCHCYADGNSHPGSSGPAHRHTCLSKMSRFHRRTASASQDFNLGAGRPREEDLSCAFQRLLKNYADKKALLQIREEKILQLNRENCGLRDVNALLGEKLKATGTTQDLSELTAEFTERLAQTECRLRIVSRERDQLKMSLAAAQAKLRSPAKQTEERSVATKPSSDTSALNKRIAELESALSEKIVQVNELMKEGEQLAQAQLKANTTIKQLRSREKEAKKSERAWTSKSEQLTAQLERTRNEVRNKDDTIRELTCQLEHLTKITQAQEGELQTVKVQLSHSESSLQDKEHELENLKRELLGTRGELEEAQSRAEHGARSSASEQALRESCATLREQLDAARVEYHTLKRSSDERYSQWREEREYYQRLVAETNARLESMDDLAQTAAQPALRQLESLQTHLSEQTADWNRRELSLNQQIAESKKTALLATESERTARQQLQEAEDKLNEMDRCLSDMRAENECVREKLLAAENNLRSSIRTEQDLFAQLTRLTEDRKADMDQLNELRNQLNQERATHETLITENERLNAQVEKLQKNQMSVPRTQSSKSDARSILSSSVEKPTAVDERFTHEVEVKPTEPVHTFPSPGSSRSFKVDMEPTTTGTTFYPNEMGSQTVMEHMQALVRLKDGELAQLRREVEQLNRAKDSLLSELAKASANSERLARLTGQTDQTWATDSQLDDFQELQRRYNELLLLHGRITEENTELRMDLADMKEMYKAQIDMLLRDRSPISVDPSTNT